jgi:UDP-glucose-4-epimerase GalE
VNTLNLLDAMHRHDVDTIVLSSSCATYGAANGSILDEEHRQSPQNPYGESKLMAERLLRWYGGAYGMKWAALRYFNAAGADAEGELGEFHDPETHLIPRIIRTAAGDFDAVDIYGMDWDTPDGTAIRDYVHVTDLAAAHSKALCYLSNGGESGAFNLGSGCGYSVREVITAVEQVTGFKIRTRSAPRRSGDVPILRADCAKARDTLLWAPESSDLRTIIHTDWRWRTEFRHHSPSIRNEDNNGPR